MYQMTLTLQFAPQGLVRVVLGPERGVYVPIQHEKSNGSAWLHRNGDPIWGNDLAELFIAACPYHIVLTLGDQPTRRHATGALLDVG
jgi:hypothetical protein